jgi:hypothetical protein
MNPIPKRWDKGTCPIKVSECSMIYNDHTLNDNTSMDRGSAVYDSWINYLNKQGGCKNTLSFITDCKTDIDTRSASQSMIEPPAIPRRKKKFNGAKLQIKSFNV